MEERFFAYSSVFNQEYPASEIESIAQKSTQNNQAFNITGVLVFDGNKIFQYLEGSGEAIKNLIKNIQGDPRHFNFKQCSEGPLSKRSFQSWSLALIQVDDHTFIDSLEHMTVDKLPLHLNIAMFKFE